MYKLQKENSFSLWKTVVTTVLVTLVAFYLLQYLPWKNPTSQIPEFPVLVLLMLVGPFIVIDTLLRGYHFLCRPRESLGLYVLGLSQKQREKIAKRNVKDSILQLFLIYTVAIITIVVCEYSFFLQKSLFNLLFYPVLLVLELLLFVAVPSLFIRLYQKFLDRKDRGSRSTSHTVKQDKSDWLLSVVHRFSKICKSSISQRVFLKRLWIYLFKMEGWSTLPLFILIITGTIVAQVTLISNKEYYLLVGLLPLIGFITLLHKCVHTIRLAKERAASNHYLPFTKDDEYNALLQFSGSLLIPFALLLIPMVIAGYSFFLWGTMGVAMGLIILLFSKVMSSNWNQHEIPVWYTATMIAVVLCTTLSWGGMLVLILVAGLTQIRFEKKKNSEPVILAQSYE